MEEEFIKEFYEAIRRYGVKKAERESGVTRACMYNWFAKAKTPTFDKAIKIAKAIGYEFKLVKVEEYKK